MLLQPVPHRLNDLPAIAPGQVDETLYPQHIVQADRGSQSGKKCIPVLYRPSSHDKTLEIVVIVSGFELVHRGAGGKVVLGSRSQPERHLWRPPCPRAR